MRTVDVRHWSRQEHFELFNGFDHPHFGLCANVDVTILFPAVKQGGFSFTATMMYVVARASNRLPPFRYRIRGDTVVEHEVVHPSVTILGDEDVFGFCTVEYDPEFAEFVARATERIARVRACPSLEEEPGRDDLLFMSAIPWVSFTSFKHPMHLHPADAVPRFAWGKIFGDDEALKMPLAVQVHHALMDGVHVGRFYAQVQALLDHPDFVLGSSQS